MQSRLSFLTPLSECEFLPGRKRRLHYEIVRHITPGEGDPYVILGVPPGAPLEEVRAAYRRLVKEHHPDRYIADGTPTDLIRITEQRMAAINAAYAEIVGKKPAG